MEGPRVSPSTAGKLTFTSLSGGVLQCMWKPTLKVQEAVQVLPSPSPCWMVAVTSVEPRRNSELSAGTKVGGSLSQLTGVVAPAPLSEGRVLRHV